MEIAEYIYGVFVEHSYKKSTRVDANRDGLVSKTRGESASSTTYSEIIETLTTT